MASYKIRFKHKETGKIYTSDSYNKNLAKVLNIDEPCLAWAMDKNNNAVHHHYTIAKQIHDKTFGHVEFALIKKIPKYVTFWGRKIRTGYQYIEKMDYDLKILVLGGIVNQATKIYWRKFIKPTLSNYIETAMGENMRRGQTVFDSTPLPDLTKY
jgi:hypothetical protein